MVKHNAQVVKYIFFHLQNRFLEEIFVASI